MTPQDARDDAISQLAGALKAAVENVVQPPRPESWFARWANTPFIVTLLGGLFGTVLTLTWKTMDDRATRAQTEQKATTDAQRAALQRQYDMRYSLMLSFCSDMPGALARFTDFHYSYVWLNDNHSSKPKHASSGLTYQQVWADYKIQQEAMARAPVANSFPPQILSIFSNSKVHELAILLRDSLTRIGAADTEGAISKEIHAINDIYDKLIVEMGNEVILHGKKISI